MAFPDLSIEQGRIRPQQPLDERSHRIEKVLGVVVDQHAARRWTREFGYRRAPRGAHATPRSRLAKTRPDGTGRRRAGPCSEGLLGQASRPLHDRRMWILDERVARLVTVNRTASLLPSCAVGNGRGPGHCPTLMDLAAVGTSCQVGAEPSVNRPVARRGGSS
jgi:hypothetical protein